MKPEERIFITDFENLLLGLIFSTVTTCFKKKRVLLLLGLFY